jgi:phosphoribosylformylglycinamidine synthase
MIYVLEDLLDQKVEKLWHKDRDIKDVDFVILPGGFSYGDYLRSGAIAKLSPIMGEIIKHANQGGYVMGVCNGFQILTETGLLEGALLHNNNQKFICKNSWLKPVSRNTAITKGLSTDEVYKIPIAHAEGRYYAPNETIERLSSNDQILFKYCTTEGEISGEANPNGSVENIAGICNTERNVFGMMPHPERAADEELANTDGKEMFLSIIENCQP